MSRQAATDAEVVGSPDQARSEMVLPNPVDDHAPRQRVVAGHDPTPATGQTVGRLEDRLLGNQGRRHRGRHQHTRLVRIASIQQMSRRWRRGRFEEEVALRLFPEILAGQLCGRQSRTCQLGPPLVLTLQTSKDGHERVIVASRQWIELVVVTPGTAHCHTQEDL